MLQNGESGAMIGSDSLDLYRGVGSPETSVVL